ncbi:MAG: Rv3235 family protein [Cellulomonadaceae bacterium]
MSALTNAPPPVPPRRLRVRTTPRTEPEAFALHVVPTGAQERPLRSVPPPAAPPEPPGDPTAMCCSVVQAVAESLRGIRPLAQVSRWLAPEIYEVLARRRAVTLAASTPPTTRPARIRRARVLRLAPDVAEASIVIDDVTRVRAAAVRLEHRRGAWRVVALELG